jgi:preflagellin peptidase FlaK
MLVGLPVHWSAIETTHGKLLESPTGIDLGGLDLDALRMYLRWRGITLPELREHPDKYRDPATIPTTTNPPTDGAITDSPPQTDGGHDDDPWGAEQFLTDISHSAYGTTPTQLRAGLDVVTTHSTIWISPGIPFILPIFLGLLIAFTYGDIFFTLLATLGIG